MSWTIMPWKRQIKSIARIRGVLFFFKRKMVASFPNSTDASTVCIPMNVLEDARLYVKEADATNIHLVLDGAKAVAVAPAGSSAQERVLASFATRSNALEALRALSNAISPDPLRWAKRAAMLGILYLVFTTPFNGIGNDGVAQQPNAPAAALPAPVPAPAPAAQRPVGAGAPDPFGLRISPN